MVVTYRQTRSTRSSREALDASPTSITRRVAAMCIACLVPAGFGALWLASVYLTLQIWPSERWMHGTFSRADEFAILFGQSVVACLGGPIVGVAAARWLRFRGAALLLVIGMVLPVSSGARLGASAPALNLRLLTPFTFFTSNIINPDVRGQPPRLTVVVPGLVAHPLRPRPHRRAPLREADRPPSGTG